MPDFKEETDKDLPNGKLMVASSTHVVTRQEKVCTVECAFRCMSVAGWMLTKVTSIPRDDPRYRWIEDLAIGRN